MNPLPPLAIITPNPALDRILTTSQLRLGTVRRVAETHIAAGGKGLNVARAARTLNLNTTICAPLGGLTGQQVAWLAAQEGLPLQAVAISGETRVCTLVVDTVEGSVTVLNEIGPVLNAAEWHAFTQRIYNQSAQWNLICGSLPPGVPPEALTELVSELRKQRKQVLVDSSGPALAAAVAATPNVVKVNGDELGELLGVTIDSIAAAQQAVATLYRSGIAVAVVTLGTQGAVGIDERGGVIAIPPTIAAQNPIGCGDSFFAGLAAALYDSQALAEAMRLASACAAADAQTLAPGQIESATVMKLSEYVTLSYW